MLNNLGNLSASIANYEEVHLSVLKGSFYEKNQEWDLLGYKYESGTVVGHLKRSYSLVRVYFLLERHTVYYEVTLFIPIVCINLLVCLGLWMPISCGEAAGFQVTLLLALILYLDLISTTTPVFDSIGKSPRLLILFLITTIASVVAHIIITFSMWKQSCDDDTLRNLSPFKCKFTQKTAKVLEWLTREKYEIPKAIQLIIDDAENIEKLEEEELKKAWKFYGKMSRKRFRNYLFFRVIKILQFFLNRKKSFLGFLVNFRRRFLHFCDHS
ncbi:unnamed protein product [Oikopleura dioica]|uniref:Neurotransmitter-gated ion-channel transmembrane domain-containing protein n=1 Tax=Oikopleura dioica TaxID=34765 RepID=E4XLI1_OIKDI|nr:unnamed protein product [Oikopleura dioica]